MKTPVITNSNYNINAKRNLNQEAPSPSQIPTQVKPKQVGFGNAITNGVTSGLKGIDKHGFFVEFLIVDSISMIIPRILVGLNRDKEKTGKYNIKAAKEEAGREILSGPSMNLIPMGILAGVTALKPASRIERKTLENFAPFMKMAIKATPQDKLTDKAVLSKKFAGNLFEKLYRKDANYADIKEQKAAFVEKLLKATEEKPPIFFDSKSNNYCKARNEFIELVEKLNNMREKAPSILTSTSINNDGNTAKELFNDFRKYSSDIIEKFTKEPGKKGIIKTLTENRLKLKTGTAAAAFLAVGSFLLYLPKLYQQGGLSPAQESALRAAKEAKGDA